MNYACISKRPFTTKKALAVSKSLSAEAKNRREYIRSHNFAVNVNPSTKEPEVKISKR